MTRSAPAPLGTRTVLRRALLAWGLGHLALGYRRGLVLLLLEPLAIAAWLVAALQLIDGESWLWLLPPLLLIIAIYVAQAVDAYRLALRRGAAPGDGLEIAWLLPLIVAVVATFWLVGGAHGSASATLAEYVSAWRADRADIGAGLFAQPPDAATLSGTWQSQSAYVDRRISAASAIYGSASGLDPAAPFNGLRFSEVAMINLYDPHSVLVSIDIVRSQRVTSTLFGIIPTARVETVAVETVGSILLVASPAAANPVLPAWLRLDSWTWRIVDVQVPPPTGTRN